MKKIRIATLVLSILLLCSIACGCGAQEAKQNTSVQATAAPTATPAPEEVKSYQLVGKYEDEGEHAARMNAAFLMNLNEDGTATVDRYRFSEYDASDSATNPTYDANYLSGTWKAVEKDGIECIQIKLAHINSDGVGENDQTIYAYEVAGEYSVEMTFPIVPGMSYSRIAEMRGTEEKIYNDPNAFIQAFKRENPNAGQDETAESEQPAENVAAEPVSGTPAVIFEGEVDSKMAGVGMCTGVFTLYDNGTFAGELQTKFGNANVASGTWVLQDDNYVLTDTAGKETVTYRNTDGVRELSGVWSAGSTLGNLDFVLQESSGEDQNDDAAAAVAETSELPLVYTEEIAVTGGSIRGTLNADGTIASYKGIPYAAAPVGDLRWKAAAPVVPWDGIRDCDSFTANPINLVTVNRTGSDAEFGIDSRLPMTEDSLFVNVWTQADSTDARPVIFFIPGGGFTTGGASCPLYDGEALAEKGVVFVSVNYRLGALGFLSNTELTAESGYNGSGDYAMSDLIAALNWVQSNIEAFGGDPKNVTVMGQSAGSRITHALVASPKASGLFQKVFTASADIMVNKHFSLEEADARSKEAFGEATLAELRAMEGEALVKQYGADVRVTIDGEYLPEIMRDAYADGSANRVAFVMGLVNGDVIEPSVSSAAEFEAAVREAYGDSADAILALYPVTDETASETMRRLTEDAVLMRLQYQAKAYALGSGTASYVYYMTHPYPEKNTPALAQHTQDLPYWFDNLAPVRDPYLTDTDRTLAEQMSEMVAAYAKDGSPSAIWTPSTGTGEYLRIGDEIAMDSIAEETQAVWNEYYQSIFGF